MKRVFQKNFEILNYSVFVEVKVIKYYKKY